MSLQAQKEGIVFLGFLQICPTLGGHLCASEILLWCLLAVLPGAESFVFGVCLRQIRARCRYSLGLSRNTT
jgi:hypothetical protein